MVFIVYAKFDIFLLQTEPTKLDEQKKRQEKSRKIHHNTLLCSMQLCPAAFAVKCSSFNRVHFCFVCHGIATDIPYLSGIHNFFPPSSRCDRTQHTSTQTPTPTPTCIACRQRSFAIH